MGRRWAEEGEEERRGGRRMGQRQEEEGKREDGGAKKMSKRMSGKERKG